MVPMPAIEIRNEDEYVAVVERALEADRRLAEDGIRFVGWPRYEITIRGEDFDGGVPTRIMPALVEIQRALNRAYARSVYGDEGKRLSQIERKRTELIVRLEPGSTTFSSDLAPALNAMVSNMSDPYALAAILGVASLAALAWVAKGVLTHRASLAADHDSATRVAEALARQSAEETRRLELVERLVNRDMDASRHQQDMEEASSALMRKLNDDDELVLDEATSIRGYDARRLVRQPRRTRTHGQIDGEFLIQAVESGDVRNGIRARVRNVESQQVLTIAIPEGTLPEARIAQLQEGEWSKTPLFMTINVQRLGDRIVQADLAEAGLRSH